MPTKVKQFNSPRKNGVNLPIGSSVVTLIASKDWKTKEVLLHKTFTSNANFKTGAFFACNEKFGGNSLTLIYPYIHLSGESTISSENKLLQKSDANSKEWIEQSIYVELEKVATTSSKKTSSISDSNYVIFIGLQVQRDAQASKIESTWRHWSKVGFLCSELRKSHVTAENVVFYRQISAHKRLRSCFNYCFFIGLNLPTPSDQLKCLNVLQRLRGSVLPGYVSLFQKTYDASKRIVEEENHEELFDELFNEYAIHK